MSCSLKLGLSEQETPSIVFCVYTCICGQDCSGNDVIISVFQLIAVIIFHKVL